MSINIEEIEKVFDDNMFLIKKAECFFKDTESLGDWYIDACRVRYRLPELSDNELMPDKIKIALKKAGLKSTKMRKPDFLEINVSNSYF